MGLHLYNSQDLSCLSNEAAELTKIKTPGVNILAPEYFIVPTSGIRRFLSLDIASKNMIFANTKFLNPNEAVQMIYSVLYPDSDFKSFFDSNTFKWVLMKLILTQGFCELDFEFIKNYIGNPINQKKLYHLSERIADIFEQYTIYRQDLIKTWENGKTLYNNSKHEKWQMKLWNCFKQNYPDDVNKYTIMEMLNKKLSGYLTYGIKQSLPTRFFAFGVSYLPGYHIKFLELLSRHIDIYLFCFNPCIEYWGDIRSDKEIMWLRKKSKNNLNYMLKGNLLLANMGKTGREFFEALYNIEHIEEHEPMQVYINDDDTLLKKIQYDIVTLSTRDKDNIVNSDDDSLVFSICHSPMREVEVLHDRLLKWFEDDSSLKPKDVLVMTPDINLYAPYIDAVFGTYDDIPYSIADRSLKNEIGIVNIFLEILKLPSSRFEISKVFSIIGSETVRNQFYLSINDVETLKTYIYKSGVRWGLNGKFKENVGLLAENQNTWEAGLDRLIAGYAINSSDEFWNDILPFEIVGDDAKIFGRFLDFYNLIVNMNTESATNRNLREWSSWLNNLIEAFFKYDSKTEVELIYLKNFVNDLSIACEHSDIAIDFSVIQAFFVNEINYRETGSGFLSGKLTFSSMIPLRSVPFKIICIIGMNDDLFPRKTISHGLDLIRAFPRHLDKNLREIDRYLFIETLLSAKEKLYISYTGRSNKDNSEILPSICLLELCEYIEKQYIQEDDKEFLIDRIITIHPLQSFSKKYFYMQNEKYFSYHKENYTDNSDKKQPKNFICEETIKSLRDDLLSISPSKLEAFFKCQAKFFIQKIIGIYIDKEDILDDYENIQIDNLDSYIISQDIISMLLHGKSIENIEKIYRAKGILPHGVNGKVKIEEVKDSACNIAKKIIPLTLNKKKTHAFVDINVNDIDISGIIKDIYGDKLVFYSSSRIKGKNYINVWLNHLLLNASNYKTSAIFIGSDGKFEFKPLSSNKAFEILSNLMEIYKTGLTRCLPFFPETSFKYFKDNFKIKSGLNSSWSYYNYHEQRNMGEKNYEPYFLLCFEKFDFEDINNPIFKLFDELSQKIFKDFNTFLI